MHANLFARLVNRLKMWQLAHRGETVAHLTYLGATFYEGHGLHASAAGVMVFFVVVSVIHGSSSHE